MPLSPQQFEAKYPLILGWIQQTLATHAHNALTVASRGFRRLSAYYNPELLAHAKVVYVDAVPAPPLTKLGLSQFANFENMDAGGITYLDTFFVRREWQHYEPIHFHEMVHIIQWKILGPKTFVAAYADGLERFGYRNSPLEVMAYEAEARFEKSPEPFDVEKLVKSKLGIF